MAPDYKKCAQDIFDKLGGKENLVSAAHCAARLRLVTVDNRKIDMKALEDVDGVKGVFSASGQIQIILGTGTVNKVYDEFLSITGLSAASNTKTGGVCFADDPAAPSLLDLQNTSFSPSCQKKTAFRRSFSTD